MQPPNEPPHATGSPAISVRDLWLTYPGKRQSDPIHVLEAINLDVHQGEFVCIVGPSGCGKTTLLNILGGFLHASRGEVLIEGELVRGPDRRRIFIFQEGGVFPWLTVQKNIGFGLGRRRGSERDAVIRHYVEMVGLSGFERSYPRELSGGMRQRVEIARALAANPEILFMDEPFGALDYLTRFKMRADLVRIWEAERKTILFVTHDIDEALQLAGPRPRHESTPRDSPGGRHAQPAAPPRHGFLSIPRTARAHFQGHGNVFARWNGSLVANPSAIEETLIS